MYILLALSAVAIVVFYVQNNTGLFRLSNMAEAMGTTNMIDGLLGWAYVLLFASIALVVILSIVNLAGNRKALIRTCLLLVIAVVLVGASFFLASGDPVAVNTSTPPTAGELKLTDTLLILTYILMGGAVVALIWGSIKKYINKSATLN